MGIDYTFYTDVGYEFSIAEVRNVIEKYSDNFNDMDRSEIMEEICSQCKCGFSFVLNNCYSNQHDDEDVVLFSSDRNVSERYAVAKSNHHSGRIEIGNAISFSNLFEQKHELEALQARLVEFGFPMKSIVIRTCGSIC